MTHDSRNNLGSEKIDYTCFFHKSDIVLSKSHVIFVSLT